MPTEASSSSECIRRSSSSKSPWTTSRRPSRGSRSSTPSCRTTTTGPGIVFNNRYWPAKYLIDKDGYIRYSHFGEGKYDETEQAIRLLLEEADQAVADISDRENPIRLVAPNALSSRSPDGLTRELYAGTHRNYSALRSGNSRSVRPERRIL